MHDWITVAMVAGLTTSTPAVAQWAYSETNDAMTDEKSARAFVDADNGKVGVKCDEPGPNSIYIHVISSKYLGGEGGRGSYRTGMVRFDNDKPEENSWYFRDSSAILTEGFHVWPFIDRLKTAKKFAWRGKTYDGEEITVTFNVPPNISEIDKVIATCGAVRS